jgi:hypothetical protein
MPTYILLSTGKKFLSGYRLVPGEDLNKLLDTIYLIEDSGMIVPGAATMKQMRQALVNVGTPQYLLVVNAIPGEVEDPINIQWFSGGIVIPGSDLANLIQATLGYSGVQMDALFVSAKMLPP